MKLLQLRYVWEVHRHGNHISNAALALHTSQPGVSKQIQSIEAELGFEIFARRRNRIVGLTDPGREVISIAQRVLADIDSLRSLGEEFSARDSGRLTIATTHTQARYVLPAVIERFVKRYPNVQLGLRQGNPTQICELVESGEADLAIGTETTRTFPNLVSLPCFKLPRSVVAKAGHPLLKARKLSLQELAKYPIITYDPAFSGRWKVMDAFKKAGLTPNVIFGAVDADVSKTYVELGLGIAILTTITFDPAKDTALRARDASHLFEPSTTYCTLRPNSYLRKFAFDFIRSVAPALTPERVKSELNSRRAQLQGGRTARAVAP
ncbi:MAG TPA: CysB family HTH-type transcriptional regulator [Burkholderiales bacterium]|nr:CysB family HTH-type transcriptional regulator [Burkholderiales bacterium]